MAGRVREEVPPQSPMSQSGVEGCTPAGSAFLLWGEFGAVEDNVAVEDKTLEQRSSTIPYRLTVIDSVDEISYKLK